MPIAHSKLTSQGQVSVPSEVRRRLGIGPGSVLEWAEEDGAVVVRRAGRFASEDIHAAIFDRPPAARTTAEMKEGIRAHVRRRHARR